MRIYRPEAEATKWVRSRSGLEAEASLSSGIGQSGDATVVQVTTPVKDDLLDAF